MAVYDLYKYKFAQVVTNDIEVIKNKLRICNQILQPFIRYKDINNILIIIKEADINLRRHQKVYKKIIEDKGKLDVQSKR